MEMVEHTIDTGDSMPTRCRLQPVNAHKRQIMNACIEDLLQQDLLQPSSSHWSSEPVLVEKSQEGTC